MKKIYLLFFISIAANITLAQKASVVVQTGHFNAIKCMEFSPDAKYLVSGSSDNGIIIYDVNAGMQMASCNIFGGNIKQAEFTPDSKRVMALSDARSDRPVQFVLFDISKNDTVYTIRWNTKDPHSADHFRLSYDGKLLAMLNADEFFIYDFANGKLLYKIELEGRKMPDNELWQFMHDSKRIICEDDKEGLIYIVDVQKKMIVKTITAPVVKHDYRSNTETGILSVDDQFYLRCSTPFQWFKYDLNAGSLVSDNATEDKSENSPSDFHVYKSGKEILVNYLGELVLYETESGKKIKTINTSSGGASVSAISKDGKKIAVSTYNASKELSSKNIQNDILFIDAASGKTTKRFSGTSMKPVRVLFSNNSKNLVIACNMPFKLWNMQTADGVKSLPEDTKYNERRLQYTRFSPDDQVIFAPGDRQSLINISTNEIKKFDDHFYHNYNLPGIRDAREAFALDNAFEKIMSKDAVFKMSSGELTCKIEPDKDYSGNGSEFTPDGKYIISYSQNKGDHKGIWVYVYSAADCKKLTEYLVPIDAANEYHDFDDSHHAISHDSKRIAMVNKDYTLFDILTGKIILKKKIYPLAAKEFWPDCSPNQVTFSPDDSKIAIANHNNQVGIIETATGKLLYAMNGHLDEVNSVHFSPDGNLLASSGEDGRVILWNPNKGTQVATFIGLDSTDYIVTTPDNYYMSTKKGLKGVGFRVGNKMFPVEQFDLRQNRPDTVLQRIGVASKFLTKMYRMAWVKRVKKAGFTTQQLSTDFHVPDIEIEGKNDIPSTVQEDKLKITIRMKDSLFPLEKYNVYINDIPIYGSKGFSLKGKNLNKHSAEIDLKLTGGENKIIVSAFNSKGAESTRETFDILCEKSATKPDLYVLTIGVSEYSEPGHDLKFAVKDGNDLINTLKTGNGRFGNVKTKTVFNKDATLANIASLKSFFAETKPEDQVILYFSGHGLLDEKLDYYLALHDVSFENPSRGGLPYDVLESLIDSIPARNRLVFIDACHSGEVDKDDLVADIKPSTQVVANARSGSIGVKPKAGLKNSFDYMNMLFSDVQRGTGASVISAAGGMEFALESQDWNNGVFTYSIINGIKNNKADFNKDGQVNLSELKQYIGKTVFELTNGKQNPTMRKENPGSDFIIFGK